MKNKLSDLNNHLFAQIERLGDEDLSAEQLEVELRRTQAVTQIAREIISNGRLVLEARTKIAEMPENREVPGMLE